MIKKVLLQGVLLICLVERSIWWLEFSPIIWIISVFPLSLYLVEVYLKSRKSIYLLILSLVMAFFIYAGMPETSFLLFVFLALYILFKIFFIVGNETFKDKLLLISKFVLSGIFSIILSLPLIYLFLQYLKIMVSPNGPGVGMIGITAHELYSYFMPFLFQSIWTPGFPQAAQYSGYLSIMGLTLIILSVFMIWNNKFNKYVIFFLSVFTVLYI